MWGEGVIVPISSILLLVIIRRGEWKKGEGGGEKKKKNRSRMDEAFLPIRPQTRVNSGGRKWREGGGRGGGRNASSERFRFAAKHVSGERGGRGSKKTIVSTRVSKLLYVSVGRKKGGGGEVDNFFSIYIFFSFLLRKQPLGRRRFSVPLLFSTNVPG